MLLFVALAVFVGNLQRAGNKSGSTDKVTSIVRTLISPVSRPSRYVSTSTSDFLLGITHARQLAAENRMLRDQASIIAQYSDTVKILQSQYDEARRALALQQIPGRDRVPADVISFSAAENRLQLNVGSTRGITPGMAVESGKGLVGTVETVEANRCQVLLITSRIQIAVVDASRNPSPPGFMKGRDASTVEVVFLVPKAPVEVGDLIVTSGIGGRIPRGIKVGKVLHANPDEDFGSTVAVVDPAIDIGSLREVFVLK